VGHCRVRAGVKQCNCCWWLQLEVCRHLNLRASWCHACLVSDASQSTDGQWAAHTIGAATVQVMDQHPHRAKAASRGRRPSTLLSLMFSFRDVTPVKCAPSSCKASGLGLLSSRRARQRAMSWRHRRHTRLQMKDAVDA
jgi:hypothetical protein